MLLLVRGKRYSSSGIVVRGITFLPLVGVCGPSLADDGEPLADFLSEGTRRLTKLRSRTVRTMYLVWCIIV